MILLLQKDKERTMKKDYIAAPFQIASCEEPMPVINEDQVLLKVMCVGICGSDSHTYHGKHPTRNKFPLDFGHEVSGVIVEVGKNVKGYAVGERVTVEPQKYCGHCPACLGGHFNVCENLKVTSMFFREYAAVDSYLLHRCPQDMSFEKLALVEPVAVAVASVDRVDCRGARVCVIGAGTIGNLIAQVALHSGAKDVMVTDIIDKKLTYAKRCGIPHCVNTMETPLKDAILTSFGPEMADIIIDAAASGRGFADMIEAARPRSEIVITGSYKESVSFDVTRIQRREISMIGHFMYVRKHFERAIDMLYRNELYTEGFVAKRFDLDHMQEAMEYIDNNPADVMKTMCVVAGEE